MKKIIICFVLWLCTISAFADENDTTQFTEFGFKGKVKNVTCFYSKDSFGDIVRTFDTAYSISFDETGKLLETNNHRDKQMLCLYEQGKLIYITKSSNLYYDNDSIIFQYNDLDLLEKIEKWNYQSELREITKYKYNASNRITEKNEYKADGTLTYRTIYNYNAKGQLEREQRLHYYDYWGDGKTIQVRYEYDSSFVYGASGKIIRDSCNYQDSYNKLIRQVAHKYSYDENGRLKKVDYEFYTNNWWPEKGVKKTQILPKRKTEYSYNASGSVSVVKEFKYDYLFPGLLNLKEPDKLNGVYKTKETNFLYNNGKRIQIIVTFYDRVDYLSKSLEIKPTEKVLYNCDMYGNWTEKRVFVIKDGLEFFKTGIDREITYFE